jgi:hypothetical protein
MATSSAPRTKKTTTRTASAPRTGSGTKTTATATRTTPQFQPSRYSSRAAATPAAALQKTDDPRADWKGRAAILKRVMLRPWDYPVYGVVIYGGLAAAIGGGIWWWWSR